MYNLNPRCEDCGKKLTDGEFNYNDNVKVPKGKPYRCRKCSYEFYDRKRQEYMDRVQDQGYKWGEQK